MLSLKKTFDGKELVYNGNVDERKHSKKFSSVLKQLYLLVIRLLIKDFLYNMLVVSYIFEIQEEIREIKETRFL